MVSELNVRPAFTVISCYSLFTHIFQIRTFDARLMAFPTQHFRNSPGLPELRGSNTPLPTYFLRTAVSWSGPAVIQQRHTCLHAIIWILHGLRHTVITGTLTLMPPSIVPVWGTGFLAASQTQGDSSTNDSRQARRWGQGLPPSWNTVDAIAVVLRYHPKSLQGLAGTDGV